MDQTYTVRGAFGEPIAEYAGGTPVLKYWNYVRPDGVVIGRKEGANRFFYHRDHLGSTRTVLSQNSTPTVVETYDYMPFGEFMSGRITTSGTGTRPKFTGHAFDDETNLHTMQWRRQIPRYGVFRTPDPLADSYPGWNAYAYVMNDPMRYLDPTGLCPTDGSAGMDQETGRYCTEAVVVTADRLPWTLHVTYERPNFIQEASMAIPASVWNATRTASNGGIWGKAAVAGVQLGVLISATHNWLTFKDSEEIEIWLPGIFETRAPGVPKEGDGFVPKKGWDGKTKVRTNNGEYGYPAKDGGIWVPTGVGGSAHGGPHWDVQYPNGTYDNVYPGGNKRPGNH